MCSFLISVFYGSFLHTYIHSITDPLFICLFFTSRPFISDWLTGGTSIEDVAEATPELIFKQPIDIMKGTYIDKLAYDSDSLGCLLMIYYIHVYVDELNVQAFNLLNLLSWRRVWGLWRAPPVTRSACQWWRSSTNFFALTTAHWSRSIHSRRHLMDAS